MFNSFATHLPFGLSIYPPCFILSQLDIFQVYLDNAARVSMNSTTVFYTADLAKLVLHVYNEDLLMVFYVPEALKNILPIEKWFGCIYNAVNATPEETYQEGVMTRI